MRSLVIVIAQPSGELRSAVCAREVIAPIGPFAQHGLNEALGLAVGLWRPGFGAQVSQPQRLASVTEAVGEVAAAVVGKQTPDGNALLGEPGMGAAEKRNARSCGLVGQDLGIGEAGMIINGHVHEVPADRKSTRLNSSHPSTS